jgi:hypothetical protein
MLDYSISGLLVPSISLGFYDWTIRGGSSSMALEQRSWFNSPRLHNFSLRVFHPHWRPLGPQARLCLSGNRKRQQPWLARKKGNIGL